MNDLIKSLDWVHDAHLISMSVCSDELTNFIIDLIAGPDTGIHKFDSKKIRIEFVDVTHLSINCHGFCVGPDSVDWIMEDKKVTKEEEAAALERHNNWRKDTSSSTLEDNKAFGNENTLNGKGYSAGFHSGSSFTLYCGDIRITAIP